MKIWKGNERTARKIVTSSERLNKNQCKWLKVKGVKGEIQEAKFARKMQKKAVKRKGKIIISEVP